MVEAVEAVEIRMRMELRIVAIITEAIITEAIKATTEAMEIRMQMQLQMVEAVEIRMQMQLRIVAIITEARKEAIQMQMQLLMETMEAIQMQMQLLMETMEATQMQMQLQMETKRKRNGNATRSQDMTQLQNMDRNQLKNNIFLNIYVYK